MRTDTLFRLVSDTPMFDLETLVVLSGEKPGHVTTQLHRWMRRGVIVPLRRGMYILADRYRRLPLSAVTIANAIYRPSYLSGAWALSFYGLIPDAAMVYTSATTRLSRVFTNPFGEFRYAHLRRDRFWGMCQREIDGMPVWIADPHKALFDYWFWEWGEWTELRIAEMRLQNLARLDLTVLMDQASRFSSPRILRAARRLIDRVAEGEDGDHG